MKTGSSVDWAAIRDRAAKFPDEAFEFVRDGLRATVESLHSACAAGPTPRVCTGDESRHISGAQLCLGLREFAIRRYGPLAGLVLTRWGIRRTDDFGVIVYALIDRKELRASERDSLEDFRGVFDFAEAFAQVAVG